MADKAKTPPHETEDKPGIPPTEDMEATEKVHTNTDNNNTQNMQSKPLEMQIEVSFVCQQT